MDKLTFQDGDGVEIFYRRWKPNAAPARIVLVVHGASEHSGRYDRLANVLTAESCVVYALDQRGHGRTASSTGPGRMGPRGMAGMLDDISELGRFARAENADLPLVIFGHSMGAFIVQLYAEQHGADLAGFAGFALSGSSGPMEGGAEVVDGLQAAVAAGMADDPMDMLGPFNAAFEPARTKFDWLSRDEAEVDRYINDPLCGDDLPLTYGFAAQLVESVMREMDPASIARIPSDLAALLLAGDKDPVSNFGAGVRELERLLRGHLTDVTACYYRDARHEILNEVNRDEVHADIVAWLTRLKAPGPSG